jgi:hypothetical protein
MSSQKKILNFFKPLSVKRSLSDVTDSVGNETNKKLKPGMINEEKNFTSREKSSDTNGKYPYLSNYLQAKIKLTSKRYTALHTNVGESWFEALCPEFGKPYFAKVVDFAYMY